MITRECTACGQRNRIPPEHLADQGKCGKCSAVLAPLDTPIDVEDEAMFDSILKSAKVPVLVDFWAEWCGPCRMAAPEVRTAAKTAAGKGIVLKVDTEQLGSLAARYRVQGIPNFAVFREGQMILQRPGMVKAPQLLEYLATTAPA